MAKQHPDIVARMQAQMPLVNFNTYTDEALLPEEEATTGESRRCSLLWGW